MEALAILTSIPQLVELIAGTVELVRACSSKSSLANITKGLDVQLELLGDILTSLETRWKARTLPSDQLVHLAPIIAQLRDELASLNRLLSAANAANRLAGFLRRAKLAVTGFEKHVKLHTQRVESLKTTLTLKLADGIHAELSGMQR